MRRVEGRGREKKLVNLGGRVEERLVER